MFYYFFIFSKKTGACELGLTSEFCAQVEPSLKRLKANKSQRFSCTNWHKPEKEPSVSHHEVRSNPTTAG